MTRFGWQARSLAGALGGAGAVGLACGLAAAALFTLGIGPAGREIAAETARLERLVARAREAPGTGSAGAQSTPERLAAFYAFFPPLADLPAWLERIYAAAERHGIALDKGEYVLTPERDGKLARYQLTLPVKAAYPRVRAFIEDVLKEVPAAMLESVVFQREGVGAGEVEAQLRMVLVLGGT